MKNTNFILKNILLLFLLSVTSLGVYAVVPEVPIKSPALSTKTGIAPAFFGPNAFPVPDMLNGDRLTNCRIELYTDHYFGTIATAKEDYTANIFARLAVPLFSSRVNLVLWGNLLEYYSVSPFVNNYRRVEENRHTTGLLAGDIYISTDITMLYQEKHWLDMVLRVALKTASGGEFGYARYYDNAGYFFDATLGRRFFINKNNSIKLAVASGFLCWQTDNGRQNDAVMYGVRMDFNAKSFVASAEWGGYVGWERYGDAPMTLKLNALYSLGKFDITAGYRLGIMDWPFHQVRIGLNYHFPLSFKRDSQ